MNQRGAPRALYLLGALLVIYLGYPVVAFLLRAGTGHDAGWSAPGLWSALRVSLEGATVALLIGIVAGIPLAYLLARRRGWLISIVGVIVQLPLAVPPLISGILLVDVIGPYTFLGQRSGERLTQTMWGVIIAMSFVSAPFLVIAARSAFRAVDPALSDVAATLGHGRLGRFLRVEVPAAGDGLRAGMILMWLRAFGEYGTVVVLAYHPYSLPVYVENLFSSAPLSQTEAPTLLAFAIAALAIAAGRLRLGRIGRRRAHPPPPSAPPTGTATALGFDLDLAVESFHLRVAHREGSHRLAIVGPSGSGKSVALRALAGLLGPGVGAVSGHGTAIGQMAPEQRRLGYVPQGFGLLPGRTVWQQVTFGVDADPGRAAWWLDTLELRDLVDRLPEQLSGGQRQRVSLARALAIDPSVVLLDEPFSALDAPVRAQLRRELRRLQHEVNLSTVIVTHDPEEAAMLADEIIVVSGGVVLQSGRCREVYRRPASVAVGRLLGIENLFSGRPPGDGPGAGAAPGSAARPRSGAGADPDAQLLWQVPPEALALAADDVGHERGASDGDRVDLGAGQVADVIDLGRSLEVVVALDDGRRLRARTLDIGPLALGDRCRVRAAADALSVWATRGAEPQTTAPPGPAGTFSADPGTARLPPTA